MPPRSWAVTNATASSARRHNVTPRGSINRRLLSSTRLSTAIPSPTPAIATQKGGVPGRNANTNPEFQQKNTSGCHHRINNGSPRIVPTPATMRKFIVSSGSVRAYPTPTASGSATA